MFEAIYKKIPAYQIHLLIFFSSMFGFISFASTLLFLSDNMVILNQFYNLIHGSLSIEKVKIMVVSSDSWNIGRPYLFFGGELYGKFSYSLPMLALPVYYILKIIDSLYGAHLFILQVWALSVGAVAYLIAKPET